MQLSPMYVTYLLVKAWCMLEERAEKTASQGDNLSCFITCGWVFMSFSPHEVMKKKSVVFDISDFASQNAKFSQKLNRTLEETAELIALHGFMIPRKVVCSALSSSVRQA